MSYTEQIDAFAARLAENNDDLSKKLSTLSELCDMVEPLNSSGDYGHFLASTIPALMGLLNSVSVSLDGASLEHKLRNSALEILNRCNMNETFEPNAEVVLDTLLTVLREDNEENGVLSMKILTSLFKSYKAALQDKVEDFIQVIMQIYKNMPELVNKTFNESKSSDSPDLTNGLNGSFESGDFDANDSGPSNTNKSHQAKTLKRSMFSFKTLSECPITMVTLYSSYKQLTGSSLPQFMPLVIELLAMEAEKQKQARQEMEAMGQRLTDLSPAIQNRQAYCDFLLAQIKATSFLAYVFIRGYAAEYLQNYVGFVPDLIIRLLQDCPAELSSARKELLHATRHILSTNYKKLFLPKINMLFDENVLIGHGFTSHETLRPLAYSTVADFIHNVRGELQLDDIEKTIQMYTGFLLDESLALTVQIMSAKLLLNLVERILKLGRENPNDSVRAKKLLIIIIDAYTTRFRNLNRQYDNLMKHHNDYEKEKLLKSKIIREKAEKDNKDTEDFINKMLNTNVDAEKDNDGDIQMEGSTDVNIITEPEKELGINDEKYIDLFDIKYHNPILLSPPPSSDPLKDAFYLYRTLMSFLKTIIHDIKVFNPPSTDYTTMNPKLWASLSRIFSYEEVLVFKNLFHECILGLHFFSSPQGKSVVAEKKYFDITAPSLPVSATKDGRELMDYFAIMFMQIDSPTFNDIVEAEIDFMYESMLRDSALLHVAQSFLTSEITSPNFTGILLRFLKSKLPSLGNVDGNKSNILIRLFKLSFMSVNLFPVTNEIVLLPHLNDLILDSLKYSTTAKEPLVYLYLIRTLFRSIGGGRFENLYRSIKPILQVLLQSLNRMILTARRPHERDLYVELCLTVPVRLSVLAPYLSYLMKPLVCALQGFPELITQGLRTLELCIDNLTAEYFDPIIEPVVEDVIRSLFKLLKPQPFNHQISHTAVRILGKLGGRNRRFIKPPSDLKTESELDIEVNALFSVHGIPQEVNLSVTPGVRSALEILEDYRAAIYYRKSAFKYLMSVLQLFLQTSLEVPSDFEKYVCAAKNILCQDDVNNEVEYKDERAKDMTFLDNQEKLLSELLNSLFYAVSIPEIAQEAKDVILNVTNHFCLLQLKNALEKKRDQSEIFKVDVKQLDLGIDPAIVLNAISSGLGSYLEDSRNVAIEAIKQIYNTSNTIYGEELLLTYSFIPQLTKKFIHHCYDEAYYEKSCGVLGLKTLIMDLKISVDFLKGFQFELITGLLFVLKDTPNEAPGVIRNRAENLIVRILENTCKGITEEMLSEKSLQNTLTDIVCELSNANKVVRKACQNALSTISTVSGIPIVKLMEHSKNFLLSPIFAKPLRALPFPMQIGNVDAIIYCLTLPDTFLEFNEELYRLLHEAIALVDAEDESLASAHRVTEYQTAEQLVQLRVVCIRLLALALKNEEFATAQQGAIRIRILAVFFKTMLKMSPEIIEATYQGLKSVLAENSKLPKELLQNGLKPMLMNLSDHQKLTVSGLEALARLLELLIAYFKVEIGKKLLDHLDAWCRVEVLDMLFGKDLHEQTPTKIIHGIINIFYLLPPQADIFLNDLFVKLMLVEKRLRLQLDSPFRTPMAKYLNRFHPSVLNYFKNNLGSRELVLLMCSIIKKEHAPDLREDFEKELTSFYEYYMAGMSSNPIRGVSFFANIVDIVSSLAEVNGVEWITQNEGILLNLRNMMKVVLKSIQEGKFYYDSLQLSQAIDKFQSLCLSYMESNVDNPSLLFDYVQFSFSVGLKPSQSLLDFIYQNITTSEDTGRKCVFLREALKFATTDHPLDASVFVLKHIINHTLVFEGFANASLKQFTEGDGLSRPEWLELVHNKIWKGSNDALVSHGAGAYDVFRFELLQLSAVFIKWAPDLGPELKRDVIKFSWNFIKLEDPLVKQASYMVTAYFISKYDFPVKIVTQIFVAILRTFQVESRFMVKQSLDLLAPVMHERMAAAGAPNAWVNWVRRVLSESSPGQNSTIYQFIINHPDEFYDSRDLFIPNIISQMGKLTLLTNPSVENQTTAIDLADLILYWENKAKKSKKKIQDGDEEMNDAGNLNLEAKDYVFPLNQREACVTFLIRYICVSNHRAMETELGVRALGILSELLSEDHWPEVSVKLAYFEKFLVQQDLTSSNILYYCMNTLDVLNVLFTNKPSSWIMNNLPLIQNLLDRCLRVDHHDIQEALQNVLKVILRAIKAEQEPSLESEEETPSKVFITTLSSIINEDLQGTSSLAAGVTLTWTLFMFFPQYIDPLLPSIMKTFSKLCKDHLATSQPKDASAIEEAKITTELLEKVFFLLSMKVASLGDARRPFLGTVALLIDRSMDQQFLKKIIAVARTWVFTSEIFPTVKEKAAILTKMLAFEVRGEPKLSKQFYEIILELFENKTFNNSEITVRMEQPFLVGTRVSDITIRKKMMAILDSSLERDIRERLYYVIRDQNWEFIADYPWLNQALQLLYGAFEKTHLLRLESAHQFQPVGALTYNMKESDLEETPSLEIQQLIAKHKTFAEKFTNVSCSDLIEPLIDIFYQSPKAIHSTWVNVFSAAYKSIPKNEKYGFVRSLVTLLSKDYHARQTSVKTNVVSTLLDGVSKVETLELPPHLIKYLAISYNSWYQSIEILESLEESASIENTKIVETNEDALLELYVNLQEEDMFYGLWRRRAKYTETNIALSFEQIGLWDKAQQLYEAAQVKARSGALPYSDSEYSLWEDNWIMCAEKLQHWDVLTELAKHEGFTDLLLECGWRVADWSADREALEQSVKSVMDVPTPRRQTFETFLALQNFAETKKGDQDVRRLCDEGIQLSLHKWASLPERFTPAHNFLLHGFQQYMEFLEATQVYANLATTTVQNLDSKAQEVKRVLQAWRDRLPNIWDDINMWNDLITWRQHAFQVINNAYLPLVPALQQANGNSNVNTHAYRGYHEIAWVINRFAHVARKHNMPDVCISQLARIYTLPNIEIQEAFLKLREQAKCHYQSMNELTTGLDVISNTNLVYFGTVQKAEFFTLKGMFLSKLRAHDEANQAFATAVQIDLNLAKAWAQWGFFNDRRLSEEPNNISFANNAISCYLQAAGLYKNAKTRKLLCRILWLIGIDDASGSLASAFESFRGEVPVWYWITFIPQLLTSLSHKEANMVRQILIRIAKSYPQALHFQLRTTKEDFSVIQRQTMAAVANSRSSSSAKSQNTSNGTRQPWEYLDELNGILKTAYPLLALSLESLVDQINQKFKTTPDEDLFRLINVLLIDGTYNYNRLPYPRENPVLPSSTEANLIRFSENLLPPHIRVKFNADFIDSKPNFETYIKRLRHWRNRLENKLDRAPKTENMEKLCPHLSNFHHQKFEDIEIPGQYLLNKDSNAHFVKIARFLPHVDFVRGTHSSYRRLTIRGHDGSLNSFAVQYPAVRHSRREERMFQLFRLFNETLSKNVQTRRRNIQFTLPIAVPLSPQVRIMNDSTSFTTMHQLYDEYCAKKGIDRDAIQDFVSQQLDAAHDKVLPPPDITAVKVEIFSSVQSMFLPSTVMKDHFLALFTEFEDFWLFRKQFSSQYATFIFMTYMLTINNRAPHKIYIDQKCGNVFTLEMLPARYPYERMKQSVKNFEANIPGDAPIFHNNEAVPFRLTPNIQKLVGDSALEGILSVDVFVVARALLEPDHELNTYLALFIRDEVISWYSNLHRSIVEDPQLREIVHTNVDLIIRKIAQLGHLSSKPSVATQYVLDAISAAVSPRNLAKTDQSFLPYL
ncbi:LAFE_0D08130g1_1 [Lachancea fermentati]|uniref:LAFE_0D08130g1_1 n=1 Tax=Lachancea fermentati TaxID=4955 RepID=A0A1G4MBN1_LACFM|nr:LAFE_0D08130g1_1 [Lachancea fermentati]